MSSRTLTKSRLLLRRDFSAAAESGVFVNNETRRFDVAVQCATGLELATFARNDVAFDCAADFDRLGFDFPANRSVFTNR